MHIIVVSDRLATAKTVTLTGRHLAGALVALFAVIVVLSSLFSYLTVRHAAEIRLPFLQDLVRAVSLQENERSREFLRENLNAMAVKLGHIQAQITRLDSLGERLAALAGVKPPDLGNVEAAGKDGRGGPLIGAGAMTADELQRAVDALARQVEARGDTLAAIESQILDERIRRNLLPTTAPVTGTYNASGYGWRSDPFTGETALHEGIDFHADMGTAILAAAAGVVSTVEFHPQYGNMVEVDHGNDLMTRYAHASKVVVKAGTLVKRGQKIAEVGTTGRSTGPHLHFEVRVRGAAINPARFLQASQAPAKVAASRRH